MIHYENDYVIPAIEEALTYPLPPEATRKLKLALSLIRSGGMATAEELQRELGENWVLARRRTERIVKRYGEDVKCYSHQAYEAAERRAIEGRIL